MFHQRSLRRLAATVLMVWLFGLASGIVNACIVSADLRGGGDIATPVAIAPEAAVVAHDMDGHDHGVKTVPPACERLCVGSPAAPQAEKQAVNPLNGFWLAAAPAPSMLVHAVPRSSAPLPRADRASPAAIPISIAFLRLAL